MYRLRAKATAAQDMEDEETCQEIPFYSVNETEFSQLTENDHLHASTEKESTEDNASVSGIENDLPIDDHIEKVVWVDTIGMRGKHFGWCECQLVRMEGDIYIGNYIRWLVYSIFSYHVSLLVSIISDCSRH